MTNDCVSITKTLVKGVKLITAIIKYSHTQRQWKDKFVPQKTIYFPVQK